MDSGDPFVKRLIEEIIAEDVGLGDITSQAIIPEDAHFQGIMSAREDMVVAGLPIALDVFRKLAPSCALYAEVSDGDRIEAGTVLARLSGPARGLLTAERTALNLLQHLSGISTLTRAYVDRIEGTGVVLLDTRKTIPGLRALAKYAARLGGAHNHRMRLDSGVLIKDNHIAVCGGVKQAVAGAKTAGLSPIEIEIDSLDQLNAAVEAGADVVLLDNMDVPDLIRAVKIAAGRVRTEASGGVNLETVRDIAETGVDCISVGRITQSAPAVDIGLDWTAIC
ncbi:MAG: carboxylating nicotinate-nucleotide diphosphorylase [Pseudomonadota bacterium]